MAIVKKGLRNSFGGDNNRDGYKWLTVKDGESKTIRFLTDGNDVIILKKHFLKINNFVGAVLCINDQEKGKFDCPICKVAVPEFSAPIGVAAEKGIAVIIDREDPDEPKLFEFTSKIKNDLVKDFDQNETIVDVDYCFSREKKNGKTSYDIRAIRNTNKPLTREEKEMAKKINLTDVIKSMAKSKEELEKLINGNSHEKEEEFDLIDEKKEIKKDMKKAPVRKEEFSDDEDLTLDDIL